MKCSYPAAKNLFLAPFGRLNTFDQNSERRPHGPSLRPHQSISFFALLFFLNAILFNLPAFAQDNRRETGKAPEQPSEVATKGWTGHLNYVIGYKKVSEDWAPAESQIEFGLIDFDLKGQNWPFSLVGQVLLAHAPNEIPAVEGTQGDFSGTYEFNFGLRKIWTPQWPIHPYLGGGISWLGGSTTTDLGDDIYVQEDYDSGLGYWIGTGFYWIVSKRFHSGVNLQLTQGDMTLHNQDINAGGYHVNLILGYHW